MGWKAKATSFPDGIIDESNLNIHIEHRQEIKEKYAFVFAQCKWNLNTEKLPD